MKELPLSIFWTSDMTSHQYFHQKHTDPDLLHLERKKAAKQMNCLEAVESVSGRVGGDGYDNSFSYLGGCIVFDYLPVHSYIYIFCYASIQGRGGRY